MEANKPVISIITPMYNEEACIGQNIERLCTYLDGLNIPYEYILVNDGSKDKSLEVAKEFEKKYPYFKVVSYTKNRGRGFALRTGIKNAIGKYVITTESDLNWGTDIIEKFYNTLENTGVDMVIASPYMKGGKLENVPLQRALISSLGNKVLRLAVSSDLHMVTGMTRAYKGDIIRNLYLEEDGKEIHLEIVSKAEIMGYSIMEIPATLAWPKKEKKASKRKSKFKMWGLIRTHLHFATNEAPILLFGSIGGLFLLAGFILGIKLSFDFLVKGEIIGDRIVAILSTIFLSLSGIIILLVSFLAYQLRDLRKENTKIKQLLHEKK